VALEILRQLHALAPGAFAELAATFLDSLPSSR